MLKKIVLQSALVMACLLTSAGPASATTTATAISICVSRGPDCSITNEGDHYHICVNNTDGQQCVNCPNLAQSGSQDCSVAMTGKGGTRPRVGVAGLLAQEYSVPPPKAAAPAKNASAPQEPKKP